MDKHAALIEQLKPLLQDKEFDLLFQKLCHDVPSSERFLVKMELNRLNQPSRQVIDLRDRLADCQPQPIGGVTHFLDTEASGRLSEQVRLYGDRLTVGAVESVLAHYRPERHPDKPQSPQHPANPPRPPGQMGGQLLGHYVTRGETRRTFSTEVQVHQGQGPRVEGLTLDLSVGGCQLRLPGDCRLDSNKPLVVRFVALGKEFLAPAMSAGIPYQILKIQRRKGYQYVRMKRQDGEPGQEQELGRVLQASSLRTTPEINHLLATTRSHGYERHFLSKMTALPLFFKLDAEHLVPVLALETEHNQSVLSHWQNERGVNQLAAALGTLRLSRLLQAPEEAAHRLLFSFQHRQQEQVIFFSATLYELQHSGLLATFLHTASQRTSFQVHRLGLHALSDGDRQLALRCPVTGRSADPLVQQQLGELSLVLMMEPLTTEDALAQYQQWSPAGDANELRRFGMARLARDPIRVLPFQRRELRREARFGLRTQALVKLGRKVYPALTLDVSPGGIKLQLAEAQSLERDSLAELELPSLQPLAGKLKLKGMPYRLVRAQKDGRTLHLKAEGSVGHSGVVFLSHLLSQNRAKLSEVGSARQHRQMTDGLKDLMFKQLHSLPVFAHKRGGKVVLDLLGQSATEDPLLMRLTDSVPANLGWLLERGGVQDALGDWRRQGEGAQLEMEWLIKLPSAAMEAQVLPMSAAQPLAVRQQFVREAMEQERFLALKLRLFAANRPDLDYLQQDLAAISTHALHRARELEDMLWQVQAVGQLVDISDEALCRCQWTPAQE
ncbi:PilZ domain-containing protein [Ferrimonas balearica]|uniref:PilZ domain-containing protein n=1 Tax=Ferrimonas balearica TaxID=44012 RepID=UPI001C999B2C|nr:PilZ domain-containing protein [Ferrimonas balearica]MBY5992724.1 PilZ domain-containing protein [Ferrimonas balearica]